MYSASMWACRSVAFASTAQAIRASLFASATTACKPQVPARRGTAAGRAPRRTPRRSPTNRAPPGPAPARNGQDARGARTPRSPAAATTAARAPTRGTSSPSAPPPPPHVRPLYQKLRSLRSPSGHFSDRLLAVGYSHEDTPAALIVDWAPRDVGEESSHCLGPHIRLEFLSDRG